MRGALRVLLFKFFGSNFQLKLQLRSDAQTDVPLRTMPITRVTRKMTRKM